MKRKIAIALIVVTLLFLFAGCKPLFDRNVTLKEMTVHLDKEFVLDETLSDDTMQIYATEGYLQSVVLMKSSGLYTAADYIDSMRAYGCESELGMLGDRECVYSTYEADNKTCEEVLFFYNGSAYSLTLRDGEEGQFEALIATITMK